MVCAFRGTSADFGEFPQVATWLPRRLRYFNVKLRRAPRLLLQSFCPLQGLPETYHAPVTARCLDLRQ